MNKNILRFAAAAVLMTAVLPALPAINTVDTASPFCVYAAEKLSAPAGFTADEVKSTSVRLTWKKVNGADAYRVFIYSNDTGKYEAYKTVKAASCEVKDLTAGKKYKFKVAALTKNGSKYSVQTKSKPLNVTTKVKSAAPAVTKQKPGKFKAQAWGSDPETVLKSCGIGNYSSVKDELGTTYTGEVYYENKLCLMIVGFNDDDQFYEYGFRIPSTEDEFLDSVSFFKGMLGNNYRTEKLTNGETAYLWAVGDEHMSLSYNSDEGYIMLIVYNTTYGRY